MTGPMKTDVTTPQPSRFLGTSNVSAITDISPHSIGACASMERRGIHDLRSRISWICYRSPAFFRRDKFSLLPIHGKQIRDHLPCYGERRPITVSFLLLLAIDHRQFAALSWRQLRSFHQSTLDTPISLLR